MDYLHTQKGSLHYILYGVAAVLIVAAWLSRGEPLVAIIVVAFPQIMYQS